LSSQSEFKKGEVWIVSDYQILTNAIVKSPSKTLSCKRSKSKEISLHNPKKLKFSPDPLDFVCKVSELEFYGPQLKTTKNIQ
jgi:hypothetical protein